MLFDNLKTGSIINSATLNAVLTTDGVFESRLLGTNQMGGGPNHLAIFCTGNSVRPKDDDAQRFLRIQLDAPAGFNRNRPDSSFGEVGEILNHAMTHRKHLLECLLTILRGFNQAGRPVQNCQNLQTFGVWREACVFPAAWVLGYDPIKHLWKEVQENSTEGDGLNALASMWLDRFGMARRLTVRQLKWMATPPTQNDVRPTGADYDHAVAEALSELFETDDVGKISVKSMGRTLQAWAGRPAERGMPRVAGNHIRMHDGRELCLMLSRDKQTNVNTLWLEAFSGSPEVRKQSTTPNVENGGETDSGSHADQQAADYTPVLDSPDSQPLPDFRTSGTPPAGTSKAAPPPPPPQNGGNGKPTKLADWMDRLAKFAAAPVSRGDFKAWMDDVGVPWNLRTELGQHMAQVPFGSGMGVVYRAAAEGQANG